MLTDMTPAAAGQLYPQLQSIAKSPVHGHVVSLHSSLFFLLFPSFKKLCASRYPSNWLSHHIEYQNLLLRRFVTLQIFTYRREKGSLTLVKETPVGLISWWNKV